MSAKPVTISYHRNVAFAKMTTSDTSRRALIIAERLDTMKGEAWRACRDLGVNIHAVVRARRVLRFAPELAQKVRDGTMSLTAADIVAKDRRPDKKSVVALPQVVTRVDALWISKEINKKLTGALDIICELPLASDVATILKSSPHSGDLNEKITRAASWLKELENAFDL